MRSAAIALLLFATVCLAEPGAEQIQKRGGIVHRPLPFVGNGTCEEPVSNGDLTTVRCLGPEIPLLPGQTIDCNFLLESPYPSDRNVTVLRQEAQIVSRTGENSWREVPLTEVYVHHVVPNPRFLLGEGAEIRGSRLRKALPSPLAFVVDGEEASKHETRMTNLQLVNTIGVPKDRLQSSFECWCGHPELGENSTRGSLFCCKQNPTTSAAGIEHYQLEYNITFRDATRDEKRMHFFGFDATDNKLEYNIAEPTGPNTTHTAAIEVAIDKTCPQSKPFQIVRCTAHQHIGSRCMNVYNLDKGHELICSSCPIYGTDGNSPGNEEGYVVAIQDDDPFYTIEPGTRIRVESVYDGAQKRLGVMGIIGLWVSGLTKECDRFKAEGPMSMMANAVHSTGSCSEVGEDVLSGAFKGASFARPLNDSGVYTCTEAPNMRSIEDAVSTRNARRLQQWGYGAAYYDTTSTNRWLYWGIPVIAVGCAVFVFAIVLYWYRTRRATRVQVPVQHQPQPAYGTPLPGYPDYSQQYHNDYANFGSYPAHPGPSQPQYGQYGKEGVEMGVPATGYPASHPPPRY